jgi:hypothetical protein
LPIPTAWEPFLKGFGACVFAKTEEEFEDIVKEWQSDFYWNVWQVGVKSTVQEIVEEMAQSALTVNLLSWQMVRDLQNATGPLLC